MRTRLLPALLLAAPLWVAGCDVKPADPKGEPDRVTVDHILIGVENLKPGARSAGNRSAPAAKEFAYALYEKLKAGGDWAMAKSTNSDDPPPGGPYTLTNYGVIHHRPEFGRGEMAKYFGDVAFKLKVGEMGIADYHPIHSEFGFHIIKRVK